VKNKTGRRDDALPKQDLANTFMALAELVARLRGPGGCPWDAQQTNETVKVYILEEAYEVLDAIERGHADDLCHEVGDLLFQILFLTSIAEEKNDFTLAQVIQEVTRKMINRHPHVFGSAKVDSVKEVAANWERIKKEEKGLPESSPQLLMDVPAGLPALLRSHRLCERASRLASGHKNEKAILMHVDEALASLRNRIHHKDQQPLGDEIGTILFNLADLARQWGLNAESLLRKTNQKFVVGFQSEGKGSKP
jgi:MazG family protein